MSSRASRIWVALSGLAGVAMLIAHFQIPAYVPGDDSPPATPISWVPYPLGIAPVGLAVSPDGHWIMLRTDPGHALVAQVPVGEAPVGLALADRGRRLMVWLLLAALRPAHPRHGVTLGECLRAGWRLPASLRPARARRSAGRHEP